MHPVRPVSNSQIKHLLEEVENPAEKSPKLTPLVDDRQNPAISPLEVAQPIEKSLLAQSEHAFMRQLEEWGTKTFNLLKDVQEELKKLQKVQNALEQRCTAIEQKLFSPEQKEASKPSEQTKPNHDKEHDFIAQNKEIAISCSTPSQENLKSLSQKTILFFPSPEQEFIQDQQAINLLQTSISSQKAADLPSAPLQTFSCSQQIQTAFSRQSPEWKQAMQELREKRYTSASESFLTLANRGSKLAEAFYKLCCGISYTESSYRDISYGFLQQSKEIMEQISRDDGFYIVCSHFGEFYAHFQKNHDAILAYAYALNLGIFAASKESLIAEVYGNDQNFINICRKNAAEIYTRTAKLESWESNFETAMTLFKEPNWEAAVPFFINIPAYSYRFFDARAILAEMYEKQSSATYYQMLWDCVTTLFLRGFSGENQIFLFANFLYKLADLEKNPAKASMMVNLALTNLKPYLKNTTCEKDQIICQLYKALENLALHLSPKD